MQLFTRPAPPYSVAVPEETIYYDSVTFEWAEVDDVLNLVKYNLNFEAPNPNADAEKRTDEFGFTRTY